MAGLGGWQIAMVGRGNNNTLNPGTGFAWVIRHHFARVTIPIRHFFFARGWTRFWFPFVGTILCYLIDEIVTGGKYDTNQG
jgi:hypothetical protein